MKHLVKSDVEDLSFQSRGVLVNTNVSGHEEYLAKKRLAENKNKEVANLQGQINNLNDQMAEIKSLLLTLIGKNNG